MGVSQEYNADIAPEQDAVQYFKETYPHIAPLMLNQQMADAFRPYEDRANRVKSRFTDWSRWALVMVGVAVVYSVAKGRFDPVAALPQFVEWLLLAFGAVGITIQLVFQRLKTKKAWLKDRFAAEYLRSFKFQSFVAACYAENTGLLASLVNRFAPPYIDCVQNTVKDDSAYLTFDAAKAVVLPEGKLAVEAEQSQMVFNEAVKAYRTWRLDYQIDYAEKEMRRQRTWLKGVKRSSGRIFLAGAFLAVLELFLSVAPLLDGIWWVQNLDFFSVLLFILSAIFYVWENASGTDTNSVRYEQYARDLEALRFRDVNSREEFLDLIRETERLVLRELEDFCRDAERINYRL